MTRYRVTFNGQNESGLTTFAKTVFPSGKAVEVEGEAFGRLQNHPEFTVEPVEAPKPKAEAKPKSSPAVKRRASQKAK